MDSTSLLDRWRDRVRDNVKPYFWSDESAFAFMNAAYREFVRLIGGVADFTSEATVVEIRAGEATSELHPSLLTITTARRASDYGDIEIINYADLGRRVGGDSSDYGLQRTLRLDDRTGRVTHGVLGMQKGLIRWISVPEIDDEAHLSIQRLPLNNINDFDQPLTDVEEDHHIHLIDGMNQFAYLDQDSDAFDQKEAERAQMRFESYALRVKSELERYQHKPREITYGGL